MEQIKKQGRPTVRKFLNKLPELERSRALVNANSDLLNVRASSLKDALLKAFVFSRTPEGTDYWTKICERYG